MSDRLSIYFQRERERGRIGLRVQSFVMKKKEQKSALMAAPVAAPEARTAKARPLCGTLGGAQPRGPPARSTAAPLPYGVEGPPIQRD